MHKTIIMGMNNPLSANPRHALFPYPPGCAGWRLWKMLQGRAGTTRAQYLAGFERRNLLSTRDWDQRAAKEAATAMLPVLQGRTVLLLGVATRRAFDVPAKLMHPQVLHGVTWRQLPHPSGRCLWYNNPRNRRVAGMLLEELYAGDRGDERERRAGKGPRASDARRRRRGH